MREGSLIGDRKHILILRDHTLHLKNEPAGTVRLVAALLRSHLRPTLQPFGDGAFTPCPLGLIEDRPVHAVRKIVLTGKALFRVVVISIALAIPFALHEGGRRVQDMLGRHQ